MENDADIELCSIRDDLEKGEDFGDHLVWGKNRQMGNSC